MEKQVGSLFNFLNENFFSDQYKIKKQEMGIMIADPESEAISKSKLISNI
jgi:hypothetical protein